MKICKKVFQQKRKAFNSAANRLGEMENAGALIANAQKIGKEKEAVIQHPEGKPAAKKDEKMPEWKKKSLEFRKAMLAAKAAGGDEESQAKVEAMDQELASAAGPDGVPAGMIKCPHCGRTFNELAGERHIAICVKTFGAKSSGGRLAKKGGRSAVPTSSSHQPPAVPTGVSDRGGGLPRPPPGGGVGAHAAGSAAQRKPSAHRTRM